MFPNSPYSLLNPTINTTVCTSDIHELTEYTKSEGGSEISMISLSLVRSYILSVLWKMQYLLCRFKVN